MLSNNSFFSITVVDEDSDKLNWKRARVGKKRKKPVSHRVKHRFGKRLVTFLVRYWALLIFVLVVVLLFFEASNLGREPIAVQGSKVDPHFDGTKKKLEFKVSHHPNSQFE